ncbi:MAG: hypothetical protein OHK0018_11560 [Erythrobacter tepidarius]
MTIYEQLDQMARGGSIALLMLWSWILIRDHWRDTPARLAVAMNAAIGCYLIVTSGWYDAPNLAGLVFALGAGATPGLFWLFARAWFNDEKRVTSLSALLVAVSVLNTLVVQLTFPTGGIANLISSTLFRVFMLAFAAAALWEVWRSREGDLVERRRRIRPVLVCVVALYVIVIAFVEVAGPPGLLGEQEYRLRRTINGQLGHRNFAAFLNGYRLAEVKAALADPAQAAVPIITIALDAGFGSLGPFNRAFREAEGMTPSAFRARALADSGIG